MIYYFPSKAEEPSANESSNVLQGSLVLVVACIVVQRSHSNIRKKSKAIRRENFNVVFRLF